MVLKGLYDTGADMSCKHDKVFKKLKRLGLPLRNLLNSKRKFLGAGSEALIILGQYEVPLTVGKKTINHPVYVVKNLSADILLGFDFNHTHHLNYNTERKSFPGHRGQIKVCE